MATIYYKIFEHHKKKNETWNIKYCLTHKGKQLYYASSHFAKKSDLRKDWTLKQGQLYDQVYSQEKIYRQRISALGAAIDGMAAKEILQNITAEISSEQVDFIKFSRGYIQSMKSQGRNGTARSLQPALNNLVDFFNSESVPVDHITAGALRNFEAFLLTKRVQSRKDQFAEVRDRKAEPMSRSGLHTTMRAIRILFNACRAAYNTEFATVIVHYPFKHYKIPKPTASHKRGADLDLTAIIKFRDVSLRKLSRMELARDIFMLSFYLCGMNAKDIYEQKWIIHDGRLGYGRSKTKGRRADEAFISIKVPPEAEALLDRYTAKVLQRRYSVYENFSKAIIKGFEGMPDKTVPEGITFYHARHTFATLAHNSCGMSKEDIAAALNHVDRARQVTERYIAADWSRVDKVQDAVLGLIRSGKLPADNNLVQVSAEKG